MAIRFEGITLLIGCATISIACGSTSPMDPETPPAAEEANTREEPVSQASAVVVPVVSTGVSDDTPEFTYAEGVEAPEANTGDRMRLSLRADFDGDGTEEEAVLAPNPEARRAALRIGSATTEIRILCREDDSCEAWPSNEATGSTGILMVDLDPADAQKEILFMQVKPDGYENTYYDFKIFRLEGMRIRTVNIDRGILRSRHASFNLYRDGSISYNQPAGRACIEAGYDMRHFEDNPVQGIRAEGREYFLGYNARRSKVVVVRERIRGIYDCDLLGEGA